MIAYTKFFNMKISLWLTNTLVLLFCFFNVIAQRGGETPGNYDYITAFSPSFYTYNGNEYRSASGKPGPKYWQNRADYQLAVTLDDQKNEIRGKEKLLYTNNSPDNLDFLWIQLDQNMFKKDSRGNAIIPVQGSRYGADAKQFDGGFRIHSVQVDGKDVEYHINDTRMQVFLAEALPGKGGELELSVDYSYIIPEYGSDRTGILNTKHGKIFAIAQWYPRIAVYDDVLGWNTAPYTGPGEFYLEYGNIDVSITVPNNHIVVCGGELLNPGEVFTPEQQQRWEKAHESDETIMIRSMDEIGKTSSRPSEGKERTWKFRIENTRDIAWASSAAFIVDAARIKLQEGKTALAVSAYPEESKGRNAWGRSTEYVKGSVEHYSSKWLNYPYPVAVNVAANLGGMEYPGIVFCDYKAKGEALWNVTDHEFGHIWFPMIVGSNERLHAWMDEGFNTFINDISSEAFNGGEYKPEKQGVNKAAILYTNPRLEPIMTTPLAMNEKHIGLLAYYKPAMGLHLLREQILGPERFDRALRTYIQNWAYKHPTPNDFFRTIENVSGEDLGWFWRGWFQYNWQLDQAVSNVRYVNNNPQKGAIITIDNLERMPMPVFMEITTESGKSERITLPVEIWERNTSWEYMYPSTERISRVQLDPDRVLPDYKPENNRWEN